MKVIVHNLSKMKGMKGMKTNNQLQNLINNIIDFDLIIEDKDTTGVFKDTTGVFKDTTGVFKDTTGVFKDTIDDIIDMEKVAEEFKNNIINNIINE